MNKLIASGIIGLIVAGGAIATPIVASAHDETPCSTALLAQTDLETQVKAAIGLDTVLSDAQAKLVAANVELAAAIKADNDAGAKVDSARTIAAKAAVAAATTAVAAAKLEADKTDAVDLRVKLAVAIKVASKACKGADGVTPTPTVPVPPQVVVVPRAIDTGEA